MNPLRAFALVLVTFALIACSALSLEPAKSLPDQIAYGNGSLTAVLNATATSLDAHQISSDDAKAIKEMALKAAYFLDAAAQATTEAEGRDSLALATAVLTQLQTYLNSRSKQ